SSSEHPIARAITAGAQEKLGVLPTVGAFTNLRGLGVEGTVDGREVLLGRLRLLAERSLEVPDELAQAVTRAEADGRTAVTVGWDGRARGALMVADA
ncbi:heavy metal translocating P-type ATPase, partial [Mycobacterium sp. ITM-2017-0098]